MGLDLNYEDGQTLLEEEEREGLLLKSITTHADLNEHEQLNIEQAIKWLLSKNLNKEKILTVSFIKQVHKKMFNNVWVWAGQFRKTEKNIGIKWIKIEVELKTLIDDTNFWIKNKTYLPDEIAIRFKHRLVSIHCFANGNGRHSRLMADIVIESIFNKKIFTWNQSNLLKVDELRNQYIKAIKAADIGNIKPLIKFARS